MQAEIALGTHKLDEATMPVSAKVRIILGLIQHNHIRGIVGFEPLSKLLKSRPLSFSQPLVRIDRKIREVSRDEGIVDSTQLVQLYAHTSWPTGSDDRRDQCVYLTKAGTLVLWSGDSASPSVDFEQYKKVSISLMTNGELGAFLARHSTAFERILRELSDLLQHSVKTVEGELRFLRDNFRSVVAVQKRLGIERRATCSQSDQM